MNYVDVCKNYQILLQDSGLVEKPNDSWNTFEPQEDDFAFVCEEGKVYVFSNGSWEEYDEELNTTVL